MNNKNTKKLSFGNNSEKNYFICVSSRRHLDKNGFKSKLFDHILPKELFKIITDYYGSNELYDINYLESSVSCGYCSLNLKHPPSKIDEISYILYL